MSKRDLPRVVFELSKGDHKKARAVAKKDHRKTVSAHAKVVYLKHLHTKTP